MAAVGYVVLFADQREFRSINRNYGVFKKIVGGVTTISVHALACTFTMDLHCCPVKLH